MAVTSETGIDRGDTKTATVTFTNGSGSATDPTTVTVYLTLPDGSSASYVYGTDSQVSKSTTGVFVFTYRVLQSGTYQGAMVGTGAVAQTARWAWQVLPDPFAIT